MSLSPVFRLREFPSAKSALRILAAIAMVLATLVAVPAPANAAPPVTETTIQVEKTGSEPFDALTWTGGAGGVNPGLDADENNNVVRLQDSITYKVEASVNDADVQNLVSEVLLDKKQQWIEVPTGCQTDPALTPGLNPVSEVVDSVTLLSGGDQRLLICNFGPAIEGTNRVVYPAARVVGASFDGTEITINDDYVGASVSTTADGISNVASSGPTSTNVTANFKVNLTKTLKIDALDPLTNEPLYAPTPKLGPAGEQGMLMEYKIYATYQQGSMIADSDEATFEVDYSIFDYLTDNHTGNDGAETSGMLLYDWDAGIPGCSLEGNHGANAAVTCTQGLITGDFNSSTGVPGGGNDPTVSIDLNDIDVRDPDGDGHLFEININLWFSRATEIEGHQSCIGANAGNICENLILNGAGVFDAATGTNVGFNPTSTEDASGNNLPNYNGVGEPHPTDTHVPYVLTYANTGSHSAYKSFFAMPWGANPKINEQSAAPGEIVPVMNNVFDYRKLDGAATQLCDKIDQSMFEFVGFSPAPRNDLGYSFNFGANNPNRILFNGSLGTQFYEGSSNSAYLYSNEPHATLTELRDDTCEDDVNNDGVVNIVDAAGTESSPGNPVDWWEDAAMVPGGPTGVSKVRWESFYDAPANLALYPDHVQYSMTTNYLVRILPTALGYGSNNWAPNMMTYRSNTGVGTPWTPWTVDTVASLDPEDAGFSYSSRWADRMTIVPSSHSITKGTDPAGLKVVRGGDDVDFIITPQINGIWDDVNNNTATVKDNLPAGTDYVFGSEMFSVDGGTTWLSFAAYQASSPVVTITNLTGSGHAAAADPLVWQFGSLENGDSLPLIKYTVHVDDVLTSGSFDNIATIDSPMGIDADGDGNPDPKTQKYRLSIFPEFGFDVLKVTGKRVWEVKTPFEFDLIYKNLGGEDYTAGDFIDILPWNGDGAGVTGGLASPRDPATTFNGTYEVTGVTGSNGETFYATTAPPATLTTEVCSADNTPAGYVPAAGDVCEAAYVLNGNFLPDGNPAGLGTVTWDLCTSLSPLTCGTLSPEDITAIRFVTSAIPANAGGRVVSVELTPTSNVGGTPALDLDGEPTPASTGDIYTNNFGGRIPESTLRVISNDQAVTMVAGTIGDYVWFDENGDGVQDATEAPLEGVDMLLLVEDPNNPGSYIPYQVEDPANPGTFIDYVVTTAADGSYLFENLPSGNYQVQVDASTLPPGATQTYDSDGGDDNTSNTTLFGPGNPDTANGFTADDYIDVTDDLDQDFGYDAPEPPAPNGLVQIEKATNDVDGDTATGPAIPVGDPVTWTYEVTNTGNVPLANATVTDDQGVTVSCDVDNDGDPANDATNIIPFLMTGASLTCEGTSVATDGQYSNNSSVSGTPQHPVWEDCDCNPSDPSTWPDDADAYEDATGADGAALASVTDEDPSHYFGGTQAIDIEKATNGVDADTPTGPVVTPGDLVTWTYEVTATGNIALANATVTDDQGVTVSCDVDGDGDPANDATNVIPFLLPGASVTCEATGTAVAGQYTNMGSVSGTPQLPGLFLCGCDPADPSTWPDDGALFVDANNPDGTPVAPVTDADPSHYFGAESGIDIEKDTNGEQSDEAPGQQIPVGDAVAWTYEVMNTGLVALADAEVSDSDSAVTVMCDIDGDGTFEATNLIPLLLPGASVTCEATGVAVGGPYMNDSSVSGTPVLPDQGTCDCDPADASTWPNDASMFSPALSPAGDPLGPVTDEDPSHYTGTQIISGTVWDDTNGDGIQDPGETVHAGVVVELLDENGDPVLDENGDPITTTTDENGDYSFPVPPGEYRLRFTPPAGTKITLGSGDDNSADPTSLTTDPIEVLAGVDIPDIDTGLVSTAQPTTPGLAFTGSSTFAALGVALAMIMLGGSFVLLGRRPRRND